MINEKFKIILKDVKDTSEVPKDLNIYYHCLECDDIIPSVPKDNIACRCDNIYIDIDMWRLDIRDYTKFEVVKHI